MTTWHCVEIERGKTEAFQNAVSSHGILVVLKLKWFWPKREQHKRWVIVQSQIHYWHFSLWMLSHKCSMVVSWLFHRISLEKNLPLPPKLNATRVVRISSCYCQDRGGIHFCTFLEKRKKKTRKKKSEHSNTTSFGPIRGVEILVQMTRNNQSYSVHVKY